LFGPSDRQLLKNASVIPVGDSMRASVSTSGGRQVDDPENPGLDSEAEQREMLDFMTEAFELADVPHDQEMSCCVKALLVDPSVKEREGAAGARLVTFSGATNLVVRRIRSSARQAS
jgi:hypothetical protein